MVSNSTATLAGTSAASQQAQASWAQRCAEVLLGTLCVALAAHIAVPLPWTPVPLTLQPMAVLLVGLLAGPWLGFATLTAYVAEGAMGLPVFQPHGPGGLLQLAGPTGGFLWSYPVVALIAGAMYRRLRFPSHFASATVACVAATAVLFVTGAAQLAVLTHGSLYTVLMAAVVPFLPGEAVKIVVAASIATAWAMRTGR